MVRVGGADVGDHVGHHRLVLGREALLHVECADSFAHVGVEAIDRDAPVVGRLAGIQAILAGRADTYVNDVNTVDQAVKANPDKLEKALAVTIPYSVGIAVPKDKPEFRDAVLAALIEVQKAGIHMDLLKKWELDVNNFKEPDILSVK